MISIIHPSRGRPEKSYDTICKWANKSSGIHSIYFLVSLDYDDPKLDDYKAMSFPILEKPCFVIQYVANNRSSIQAINEVGPIAKQHDIILVLSDDTDCFENWDLALLKEVEGKTDWILKTQDGIQPYIITMPVMDRAYYNRTGYIYHPDFQHLFCDTYLTCVADITGRKITSNLLFKHNHYSVNGTPPDDLHKRNDATWKQGQETFIKLMKQFTRQERARIKDPGMRSWLRNHGV